MIYKGKIFKIPFPFTNLKAVKNRPVLALSEPNEYGDIRFAFVTTKNHQGTNQVHLKDSDFAADPLPLKSFIQLDKIADFLDVENVLLTNSGSSANLLAFSALTSEKLGEKRLKPGDEVISVAAGFPATVTPIIQYDLIPVFVDVDIPTYNVDVEMMRKAITPKPAASF